MGRRRILSLVVCNLVVWLSAAPESRGLAAQVSASAPSDRAAQIEKGRQVVAQVCGTCHTTIVRMLQVHKQTAEQWKDIVYFMISRGAQIMPDEIEPVTAYLAATAGSNPQATQTSGRGRGDVGGSGQTAEADGPAILQRNCQQCHELAVASKKLESEDWSAVITRMMTYGARLTPPDRQKLIEYLGGR
jgi:mono/diheme cytochrome c family protein